MRLVSLVFTVAGVVTLAAACLPSARPSASVSPPPPVAAGPATDPEWQNLAAWKGAGDHTTHSFQITGQQWRLSYSVLPPRRTTRPLCISIRRPPIEEVASGCIQGTDGVETVPAGPGVYYLFIDSDSGWALSVDQLAP